MLFLYRTRSAASPKVLSDVFGVSKPIISRTFLESINPLASFAHEKILQEDIVGEFCIESTDEICILAIDVTFLVKAPPATLSFEEKKQYWSPKHYNYGYKFLCAVDSRGVCVHISKMFPGSVHDVQIARDPLTHDFLSRVTKLYEAKILGDKGFIGLEATVPTLTPHRKNSSYVQESMNDEIASKRVLVENNFCRLKTQFPILSKLGKTPVDFVENLFLTLVYLTNENIKKYPLRKSVSESQN